MSPEGLGLRGRAENSLFWTVMQMKREFIQTPGKQVTLCSELPPTGQTVGAFNLEGYPPPEPGMA